MTETIEDAIIVEGLSKRYRRRQRRRFRLPFSRLEGEGGDDDEEEEDVTGDDRKQDIDDGWALRDVSFRVPRGSITAIIGSLASGKSTLVRILGGITRPTEGRALVAGRVSPTADTASVLMQGDMTAAKNVLQLAKFLGVPRRLASARIDDILGFADLQRYEDMPLRQYSSTMRPRLAFSALVHLDPDILLADNAIGVGAADFRLRCLEYVKRLNAERGLTVLVTTGTPRYAVRVATHAVWLDAGRVRGQGAPADIAAQFEENAAAPR